jgi:hypothetical protein
MCHFTGNLNAADIGSFPSQKDAEDYVRTEMSEYFDPANDEGFEVFEKSTTITNEPNICESCQ